MSTTTTNVELTREASAADVTSVKVFPAAATRRSSDNILFERNNNVIAHAGTLLELQDKQIGSTLELSRLEPDNPNARLPELSRVETVLIIANLTGINFSNSMSTGLFTIGLTSIARDLNLAQHLLLWPASVCSLACGCTLLLSASIADAVGPRRINILGCFLLGVFILACGLARSGIELILLRACQGVAVAMCFPTSVSIITNAFPHGRRRNIAFACLAFGSHLGWAFGMLLAGLFETGPKPIGWRVGFYLTAGATITISIINLWKLPPDPVRELVTWKTFMRGVDWIGVVLSSSCLGMFSYIFAVFTGGLSAIHEIANIVLLTTAVALIPAFIIWMHRQESRGKPALIPNSIWRNRAFTALCIMVLLSWAVMISMELFMSLYFQEVQKVPILQTALRFLPNIAFGIIMNLGIGLLVHRFRPYYLILWASVITALSPLLMALINPAWSWWYAAFWAVLLGPLSASVIYTIANLVIVDAFPPTTQALAGAVFNTVSQFGSSIGTALTAVIAASVTSESGIEPKSSPEALMTGYRAVYWACFASTMLVCGVGTLGLRKVGRVGLKRE